MNLGSLRCVPLFPVLVLVLFLAIESINCQLFSSFLDAHKNVVSRVRNHVREDASIIYNERRSHTQDILNRSRSRLAQDWNPQGFLKAFRDTGAGFIERAVKYNKNKTLKPGKDVRFFLYTNSSNVNDGIEIAEEDDFEKSGFISGAPVKVICHGFLGSHNGVGGKILLPVYIGHGKPKVNVIVVDWSKYSGIFTGDDDISSFGIQSIYFPPAKYTSTVGNFTARLITNLVSNFAHDKVGSPVEKFHLMGHSLGSHAMGWAGKFFQELNSGTKLPRITGLDPAGPCYENNLFNTCFKGNFKPLSKDDATFVDIIHTHGRFYGYVAPLGHADFFPNGGIAQPGCHNAGFGICSHFRAIYLMAASVDANEHEFVARKCTGYEKSLDGSCDQNESTKMGQNTPVTARGNFYIKTSDYVPYAALNEF